MWILFFIYISRLYVDGAAQMGYGIGTYAGSSLAINNIGFNPLAGNFATGPTPQFNGNFGSPPFNTTQIRNQANGTVTNDQNIEDISSSSKENARMVLLHLQKLRGAVTIEFTEMRGPNQKFGSFCKINKPNILFRPLFSENCIVTTLLV